MTDKFPDKFINKANIKELMQQTSAMLDGHFELSSGLHSSKYFQCAKLLQYPQYAQLAGELIAEKFCATQVDIVVGPALGGLIIGYEVAKTLSKPFIFTERKDGQMLLRRGFEITKGAKILVIEDVITTAKSTKETIDVITSFGAEICGVGCIVDRTKGLTDLQIASLIQEEPEVFSPQECPMCASGIPANKPGSRTALKA